MATTKKPRKIPKSATSSFGLLANGSAGPWEVAVDESTSGPEKWFAQIDGPSASFYFEIPSLKIISRMAQFLEPRLTATKQPLVDSADSQASFALGKDSLTALTLVKDDEYDDRCFLVVGSPENPIARFTIAGPDAGNLAEALRQVEQDIDEEA